jgi:hypothetical protein
LLRGKDVLGRIGNAAARAEVVDPKYAKRVARADAERNAARAAYGSLVLLRQVVKASGVGAVARDAVLGQIQKLRSQYKGDKLASVARNIFGTHYHALTSRYSRLTKEERALRLKIEALGPVLGFSIRPVKKGA